MEGKIFPCLLILLTLQYTGKRCPKLRTATLGLSRLLLHLEGGGVENLQQKLCKVQIVKVCSGEIVTQR